MGKWADGKKDEDLLRVNSTCCSILSMQIKVITKKRETMSHICPQQCYLVANRNTYNFLLSASNSSQEATAAIEGKPNNV